MLVADLYGNPHGFGQFGLRNQIHPARAKRTGIEFFVLADHHLRVSFLI